MTKTITVLIAAMGIMVAFATSTTAQTLVEDVRRNCKMEIQTYCSDVTPGEGRILACFYAHGDKLTPRCEYSLFDAAARLERAIAAITYVANECEDEIDTYCANIEPGGGHIAQCLVANESSLGRACDRALSEVGVTK